MTQDKKKEKKKENYKRKCRQLILKIKTRENISFYDAVNMTNLVKIGKTKC